MHLFVVQVSNREEVIDYVKNKYGEDRVSQIITFNKMKAKAVIKDVARVLNIPFAEANDKNGNPTVSIKVRCLEDIDPESLP